MGRADILLTHAYFLKEDAREQSIMRPYAPLGVLYLSAFLKARGLRPEVFDATFGSEEALIARVRESGTRFVGLAANLMTRARVISVMRGVREACPGVRVIVGGPDASAHAPRYVEHGADAVVRGEGEETLLALLSGWSDPEAGPPVGVAGTTVRRDGRTVDSPDRALLPTLDGHPWPDRGAIDLRPYFDAWRSRHGHSSLSLLTARGCPYTCRWCSRAVYGESHRRRPAEDVVAEIADVTARYRPDRLWYVDDVFTIHRGWTLEFARRMSDANLRVPFECITRAERVDDSVAEALAELGCVRAWIGTESGSQRVLDAMDRRVRVDQIQEACARLRRRGVAVGFFVMVGYEGETDDDIVETVAHIRRSEPDVVLTTTAYPIAGTPYAREVEARTENDRPWAETSDRENRVRGRGTSRYYDLARAWIEADAAAGLAARSGRRWEALSSGARARWARLRMKREAGVRS